MARSGASIAQQLVATDNIDFSNHHTNYVHLHVFAHCSVYIHAQCTYTCTHERLQHAISLRLVTFILLTMLFMKLLSCAYIIHHFTVYTVTVKIMVTLPFAQIVLHNLQIQQNSIIMMLHTVCQLQVDSLFDQGPIKTPLTLATKMGLCPLTVIYISF